MTREELKAMLPEGAEDSAVTKILDALHKEIQPHKDAAKKAADDLSVKVTEMAEIEKKAATADEKTKAYAELQAKYETDIKAAQEKADNMEFDGLIDGALRGKGARNIKAARALMDMDALKKSKDRQKDIDAAVEQLVKGEDSAFLFGAQPSGGKGGVGADIGKPGGGDYDVLMRQAMGLGAKKSE